MAKAVEVSGAVAKKSAYKAPSLTVYGSVRELTGGASGTMTGDGGSMAMV